MVDHHQDVARLYDVICKPDFFGFNKNGELQYRGRLDDAMMDETTDRNRELVNVMRHIAKTGEEPQEQFPSMGCSIKWK